MVEAATLIERLGLAPHPEGGWYRETWRAPPERPGARSAGTAILFLLEAGQRSHWHRVDATELWIHQAGGALTLSVAPPSGGGAVEHRLGRDILGGDRPQQVVAPGEWQSAAPVDGWALATCVVVPGFLFSGFELAAPGWAPN